ncbi:hypothetical protein XELAEV_18032492mg [Xenopus laevis]|uniref:Leucine-rich repeat-containing protein 14 n=1 Tax=Xenopus laevis TaxID=8355 RepID=A0A974CQB6_XENLA|nr:hypothetical protein XELAEV_18032492mg [Xenopus laevis]
MESLVSVCAQKLVCDHSSLRRALDLMPKELYPALFKAAFLGKKTLVLQDLVQTWPFAVLSFHKLLNSNRHCDPQLATEKPSKLCVQTVILGVITYLSDALTKGPEGPQAGRQRLRLLDMTGMQEEGLEQNPDTMSLWSRTVTLAKACIDVSKRHSEEVMQVSKRRRSCHINALPASSPLYIEVRVDLFVNSTSYGVLREALLVSSHSPLRLQCRDFRAEELSLRSTAGLLELLNPGSVRQIDLRFNNLGLSGLNVLLPHMAKFSHLQSLKLPYSNVDVRRLSPVMEEGLQSFASQLGQLGALKELNLGSSRLSGRLRQLLGGLQRPLESLELAFCSLLPMDLSYLSQSSHMSSLRKLDLSGNNLSEFLLTPFLHLLAEISGHLLYLDVMECKLADAHLSALMPILCRCSWLRYLGLFCNPISSDGLRMVLQNLVRLPELHLVVYPFPVDCYSDPTHFSSTAASLDSSFDHEKLTRVGEELQQMLMRAQRMDMVWTTDMYVQRTLDSLSL